MSQHLPSIPLILIGSTPSKTNWEMGQVLRCIPYPGEVTRTVLSVNQDQSVDGFLLWGDQLELPQLDILLSLFNQPVDIWHAGLSLGTAGKPDVLDFVAPTWMLNCDPKPSNEASSWRVSVNACLVRKDVIHRLGFLDNGFNNLDTASLEWGHRCLAQGALVRYTPELLAENTYITPATELPFADQLRFIHLRYGKKWVSWVLLRSVLTGYATPKQALFAWRNLNVKGSLSTFPVYSIPVVNKSTNNSFSKNPDISVLIPTLDRYSYLSTLLCQLENQSIPAKEILIIDQTHISRRQPQIYEKFPNLPLDLHYLDKAGQCSSRNYGLNHATGEFILFLDDDDEIPPDLIQHHLENLSNFEIDVSCGVADEIGNSTRPKAFTLRRASDVFPTGNSMLRRSALGLSGLFDLAYEHGPRADGDLGMRLYLSGARMLLDPEIRVLHHHAPSGGLRAHKARRITYASSRRSLVQRNLPSVTELYLVRRYFSPRQVHEHLWLSVLGTFSLHGSRPRQVAKILVSALLLPHTLWQLWRRVKQAQDMLQDYPQIPTFPAQVDPL